jgi:hypothetical protein
MGSFVTCANAARDLQDFSVAVVDVTPQKGGKNLSSTGSDGTDCHEREEGNVLPDDIR